MIFDSNHLIKLVSEFDKNNFGIEEICKYCGICWDNHVIKISADDLGKLLDQNQIHALSTFQMNLVHFFEYFDKFLNIKMTEFKSKTFINSLIKDFEKRAVEVFKLMTRNFIKNLLETASDAKANENLIIENLCSGDLEKTLKLVPSRDLARQLGISDQKLRREIYLARQRALKKRPTPKYFFERETRIPADEILDEIKNVVDESKFDEYFDLEIPTCASPISEVSSNYNCNSENFDDDVIKECYDKHQQEIIDEWSIESLIRSDLYES